MGLDAEWGWGGVCIVGGAHHTSYPPTLVTHETQDPPRCQTLHHVALHDPTRIDRATCDPTSAGMTIRDGV